MKLEITRPIEREAWLAALHAKGSADSSLSFSLDAGEKLLMQAAKPKAIYRLMQKAELKTSGQSIEKHLEGCHETALMAVTLGIGVDELIRKTGVTDMAMAVIIDAGASVLVEQLADEFEGYIRKQLDTDFITSRFSPGYGDWPVTEQARIIHYLDGQRKIGLNVTADSLMIPRKSITAVLGISDHPVKGKLATCNECVLRDKCELRKEGGFCGDRF